MKKIALKFLILTGLFKVALCSYFGWHIYVPYKMTWPEAREYCREYYTDLSTFNSQWESEEFSTVIEQQEFHKGWIGLYKDSNDTWKWSGGENAVFFNWVQTLNTSEDDRCVVLDRKGWCKMNCERDKLNFYCYQSSLVLVKENKTWEEALEQCRSQGTDLVSLSSESTLVQTLQISKEAQTDHVWTGLRYMADKWLWVDGGIMDQAWSQGDTPQCPTWSNHCGALSLEEQHWASWDCADKLNFVCYSSMS